MMSSISFKAVKTFEKTTTGRILWTVSKLILSSGAVDELNLASLSLISIQSRMKSVLTWKDQFEIDGYPIEIEARGDPILGVPHGADQDLNAVLVNLFVEQGCPPSDAVTSTPYALLKALKMPDSGKSYDALRASLLRLSGTTYRVKGWVNAKDGLKIRTNFRLIKNVTEIESGPLDHFGHPFGNGSQLSIELPPQLAENIRRRNVKPLDLDFMLSLNGSATRGLFRILDAELRGGKTRLSMNLVEWGKRCRLSDLKPDRIRRTLAPAHEELVDRRYLRSVTYEGEGREQIVIYERMAQSPALPLTEAQLHLIGRVKALGVTPGQASRFVLSTPGAAGRIALAEAVVQATRSFRRGRGALAWDVLTDTQDRYAFPTAQDTGSGQRTLAPHPSAQPTLLDLPEPEASMATVLILARSSLSAPELARLTVMIEQGRHDLATVQKELVRAKASQTAASYLQSLLDTNQPM
jgi:plasmid replication initiation protein